MIVVNMPRRSEALDLVELYRTHDGRGEPRHYHAKHNERGREAIQDAPQLRGMPQ